MKKCVLLLFFFVSLTGLAQTNYQETVAENTLKENREKLRIELIENTINRNFEQPISKENEHLFESACNAIIQFQLSGPKIIQGLDKMFLKYFILSDETKLSLLEAAYSLYPKEYRNTISSIMSFEKNPKLFSVCVLYMYRLNPTPQNAENLNDLILKRFSDASNVEILAELEKHLEYYDLFKKDNIPPIKELFQYQQVLRTKIVYSFQRWNRDYPGMAIIQNEDGSFVRDSTGKLLVIQQLARAGSNLPYFITNGNTPQGIFSIQGSEISKLPFIGPTPNLQLQMPLEDSLANFFHSGYDSSLNRLEQYKNLMPTSWRIYDPMMESFAAGKIGRTEIIAHGTTISSSYFQGKPYFPISPSQGCLTAKEIWNESTGKLASSDQLKLYKAFFSTPGNKGYLMVINLNNRTEPVTRQEIEKLVENF